MTKTRRLLTSLILALILGAFLAIRGPAKATAQGSPAPKPQTPCQFITPAGASLSVLVRRCLELYDQSNDSLKLSPAAIIYAETNIVRKIGSRQLEIGEQVRVSGVLVRQYALRGARLNASALRAWQVYARSANFNLSGINPVASAATGRTAANHQQTRPGSKPTKPTVKAPEDQPGRPTQSTGQPQPSPVAQKPANPDWWHSWLLIGSAVAAILYFLASREPD